MSSASHFLKEDVCRGFFIAKWSLLDGNYVELCDSVLDEWSAIYYTIINYSNFAHTN